MVKERLKCFTKEAWRCAGSRLIGVVSRKVVHVVLVTVCAEMKFENVRRLIEVAVRPTAAFLLFVFVFVLALVCAYGNVTDALGTFIGIARLLRDITTFTGLQQFEGLIDTDTETAACEN